MNGIYLIICKVKRK